MKGTVAMPVKPQRMRDPLHNLIEFNKGQFEQTLWNVIQTHPFQRLRRIRQLGFSEFVYPGATHSRFAHSIGVFHTARRLMQIIEAYILANGDQVQEHQMQVALAAALVHDVGHGMFSHSFEEVGKKLDLKMAQHEAVSERLIKESEISEVFCELGSGFAQDVAEVIGRDRPGNLYDAVVSSQFDADRLDYMQRDRLMTGVQSGGIDFTWLIANLEVGEVPLVIDNESAGSVKTFVLGPKAIHAAETFVLALFQLYPTIYFHKATRAAEKVFTALMLRLIPLARDGNADKTGLPDTHPIIQFALDEESIEKTMALDDSSIWGALPMLAEADDLVIKQLSNRLRLRQLPKCIDIRSTLMAEISTSPPKSADEQDSLNRKMDKLTQLVGDQLEIWNAANSDSAPRILIDRNIRAPYKGFQESKGPLNQIRIRNESGIILDIAEHSPTVSALKRFHLFRAYVDKNDAGANTAVVDIVAEALRKIGKD